MIALRMILVTIAVLIAPSSALKCWSCENARSAGECVEFGRTTLCKKTEKVCQTELRFSSGWGNAPKIRTGCKEEHACDNNHIQNPRSAWMPSQCNSGKANSVCRCCCRSDLCNQNELLCETAFRNRKDRPTEPVCSGTATAPRNGKSKCQRSRYAGSRCKYSCNTGYFMAGGNKVSTCKRFGDTARWTGSLPLCRRQPFCNPITAPNGGTAKCFGGRNVGSYCVFTCNKKREMEGSSAITCIQTENGPQWTDTPPTCTAATCEDLGQLTHGNIRCSNKNNVLGTTCSFDCGDSELFLTPVDSNRSHCIWRDGKAQWNRPKPCCSGVVCPPTVKKDIVIAIDSSGSISSDEWIRMKDFVVHVLEKFPISRNNVQIAMFRFNREIDTESQINFGDHNSLEGLKKAIDNMPKNGGGTFIGQALRHVRDNILKHPNNRRNVGDMLWVLTDGRSNDMFKETAEELRENGVEVIALGITRKNRLDFMQDLLDLTGSKNLIMEVSDVINSFEDDLVHLATSKICEIHCLS